MNSFFVIKIFVLLTICTTVLATCQIKSKTTCRIENLSDSKAYNIVDKMQELGFQFLENKLLQAVKSLTSFLPDDEIKDNLPDLIIENLKKIVKVRKCVHKKIPQAVENVAGKCAANKVNNSLQKNSLSFSTIMKLLRKYNVEAKAAIKCLTKLGADTSKIIGCIQRETGKNILVYRVVGIVVLKVMAKIKDNLNELYMDLQTCGGNTSFILVKSAFSIVKQLVQCFN